MPATSTAAGPGASGRPLGVPLITWFTGLRAARPIYRICFCSVIGTTGWCTRAAGNWRARMTTGCWQFHLRTTTGGHPNYNALLENEREWQATSASAVPDGPIRTGASALSGEAAGVFVYFNNDMEGHAVKDAQTLVSLVAGKVGEA